MLHSLSKNQLNVGQRLNLPAADVSMEQMSKHAFVKIPHFSKVDFAEFHFCNLELKKYFWNA